MAISIDNKERTLANYSEFRASVHGLGDYNDFNLEPNQSNLASKTSVMGHLSGNLATLCSLLWCGMCMGLLYTSLLPLQ